MNSVEFVHILGSLRDRAEDLMISFSVASLFIKVPIVESLNLFTEHFSEDVLTLFRHAFTSTCVGGRFYMQTDGVAKGSSLCPLIADFFLEEFEERT
jgi:hypothetical protein